MAAFQIRVEVEKTGAGKSAIVKVSTVRIGSLGNVVIYK